MKEALSDKPVVVKCPYCGKQNLIAPERLKLIEKSPVKCWVCQKIIPKDLILKKPGEESPG